MSGNLRWPVSLLCFVIRCCFMALNDRKVVDNATRERGCCMNNVGIPCYVIF